MRGRATLDHLAISISTRRPSPSVISSSWPADAVSPGYSRFKVAIQGQTAFLTGPDRALTDQAANHASEGMNTWGP